MVSASFSDHGLQFYYRVVEVRQDSPDSVIRYLRVAPNNVYCPRMIVQAAEARVAGKTPAQLAGRSNPCAVDPLKFRAALRKPQEINSVFEAISYGIVANCGGSSVSLSLPIEQEVDRKQLKSTHPDMARLWDLSSKIANPVFDNKDLFHDRSEPEDLALQKAGERLRPELISGRYDNGLMEARNGNADAARQHSFRDPLSGYKGPIPASASKGYEDPKLENTDAYHFVKGHRLLG
ncbi:hypothetical protein [Paludibaculum fermentans]|uniref:Uncharacterized protein n=1 Tax=Paludibaculum fermentans TaxID=1473598 RepID=A0A7S7NK65_PALFE|nr:hypothetical protein [Paludibaculum fermentans]QOY85069.1 hypothetical protein IRI77_19685 [Paludibaculum fermentans]